MLVLKGESDRMSDKLGQGAERYALSTDIAMPAVSDRNSHFLAYTKKVEDSLGGGECHLGLALGVGLYSI